MVYLRSTCGIWSLKCRERLTEYQNQPKRAHGKLVQHSQAPKIKQVLDQNVDLSNADQVPVNAHLSEKESLYIFEDNEAVIKMIIKSRSPTLRHVSCTRVAVDGLFDRTNLDAKIQIKYVESKNQLADILTQGSFTRDEWHSLLHLFNIMNDTHFLAATFRLAILSFAQESNLKCRKALFKALRLVHERRKQKHVVSSRDTAYLWDKFFEYEILSSVDLGRKKYKLWMLFCSACFGKPRVWHRKFWRSLRNASLGKPRVHAKSRSTCERPTRTRWKRLGNIDGLREDAHFVMDVIYGFIDAGGIAHGPELRNECRNIQEFWIWKHHGFVQYYENDDRKKFRNWECIFRRGCELTVGRIRIA